MGLLGVREVDVKMIEPNHSLAEALAAILKSIIRDAVHEAVSQRWRADRTRCDG